MMAGTFYTLKSLAGWINGFVLLSVVLGVLVWRFAPPSSRTTAILAATGALAVMIFLGLTFRDQRRVSTFERLKREGVHGTAVVAQLEPTQFFINRRRQLKVTLELAVPGQAKRQITLYGSPPFAYEIGQGQLLTIYVDRNDPQAWVIDWDVAPPGATPAMPEAPAPSRAMADRLAELQKLRDAGQITADEYEAQRKRLLSEI